MSELSPGQHELLRRVAIGEVGFDAPAVQGEAALSAPFRRELEAQRDLQSQLDAASELEREGLTAPAGRPQSAAELAACEAHLRALILPSNGSGETASASARARASLPLRRGLALAAAAASIAFLWWIAGPLRTRPTRPEYLADLAPQALKVAGDKPQLSLRWRCARSEANFVVLVFDASAPKGAPLAQSPLLTQTTWTPSLETQQKFPLIVVWRVEAAVGTERASTELVWPR